MLSNELKGGTRMYKRSILWLVVIAVIFSLAFTSCVKKEEFKTVIKVGDINVSNQLFDKIKGRRFNAHKTKEDVAEDIINTILLAKAAEEKGYNDSIAKQIKNIEMDILSNALYEKLIIKGTKVSDKEVRNEYDKKRYKYGVNQIVARNKSTIDSAYTALKSGTDFADVCKKYSVEMTRKDKGGSIGKVLAERYQEPFQKILLSAKIGKYSKVFEYGKQWYIILVTEKEENKIQEFDKMKESMGNKLLMDKRNIKAREFLQKLEKKQKLVYNDSNIMHIAEIFGTLPGTVVDTEKLTGEDKELVIATSAFGEWKIKDILKLEEERGVKIPINNPASLKGLLKKILISNQLNREAESYGLDKKQIVKEEIAYIKYGLLSNELKSDIKYEPNDEDIYKYYTTHNSEFYEEEKADISIITVDSEKEAKDLMKKLTSKNFANLAKKHSKDNTRYRSGELKDYRSNIRPDLNLNDLPMKGKIGKILGPIEGKNKWVIYKINEKYPGRQKALDDVKKTITFKIRNEKVKEIIDEITESTRSKYEVWKDDQFFQEGSDTTKTEKQEK